MCVSLPSFTQGSAPSEGVKQLRKLGFGLTDSMEVLQSTNGDVNRAADILFAVRVVTEFSCLILCLLFSLQAIFVSFACL